jgi:5-methylcytosine-specific restriction enzyme A
MFPFELNAFYEKKVIWRTLRIAGQGGIRPNKRGNFVVLFLDSPNPNPILGRSHNVYRDFVDRTTGLIRYTGEGQEGDQRMVRGNLWLVAASEKGTRLHFFMQHSPGALHEYMGEVKLETYTSEIQKDIRGNDRKVFVFWLRFLSNPLVTDPVEAEDREIAFEVEQEQTHKHSKEKLASEIDRLSRTVSKGKPKIILSVRTAMEYVRYKTIVKKLKLYYDDKCQICGSEHFRMVKGNPYSEVHHLIPWSVSHDDRKENLVVLCANCHRKMHHADMTERARMFRLLTGRFTEKNYNLPPGVSL